VGTERIPRDREARNCARKGCSSDFPAESMTKSVILSLPPGPISGLMFCVSWQAPRSLPVSFGTFIEFIAEQLIIIPIPRCEPEEASIAQAQSQDCVF
jgi:hypothetical protein